MRNDEYVLHAFGTHFADCKNKNIVIYGTGPYTKLILENFPDHNIVGLMDGFKTDAECYGKSLLTTTDLFSLKIDLIIVVSRRENLKIVYERLRDLCFANQISLYGINGLNLFDIFGSGYITQEGLDYFELNETDLIKQIDSHDVISFDVFDTLIMRKTLYPTDVFEIVGDRARQMGIHLSDFKRLRIKAEIENLGYSSDIYGIYLNLQALTGISDSDKEQLLELEIATDKQVIIRREKMVEMLNYARESGKKVYLISDMYLPNPVMKDILASVGISEYEDLLVSCDYGVGKGEGLFDIFKQKAQGRSYLHIGDNEAVDGLSASQAGIDPFLIRSAVSMMQLSTYRSVTKYLKTVNDRSLMGLCLARVFNDPFSLFNTRGKPNVDQVKDMGYLFIGALITNYIFWLFEQLKQGGYDDVLFATRDGYLIQKLYNRAVDTLKLSDAPEGKYFMVSRKLSTVTSMHDEDDIRWLALCYPDNNPEQVMKKRFALTEEEILPYDEQKYLDVGAFALAHRDVILERSAQLRRNYRKYVEKTGLVQGKKYALFDFYAGGTIQYFLNKAMPEYCIEGAYLCRYYTSGNKVHNIVANSLFVSHGVYSYESYFSGHFLFLEMVITSFAPSVYSMDEEGDPVYEVEDRSENQLKFVQDMQDGIEEYFSDYIQYLYVRDQDIHREVSDKILNLMDEAYTSNNCSILDDISLVDDLGSRMLIINRNQWQG